MSETTSRWVKDITAEEFEKEVVERSQQMPVIIDFWAPWCGPCRQLGPLLEKVVEEQQGKVFLAKVNTEQEQSLASTFGVQSIPMVVAVAQGQFVDRFDGLLPEDVLREWVEKLVPSEAHSQLQQAEELLESDPASAESLFQKVLEQEPEEVRAKIGLAKARFVQDDLETPATIIAELEKRGFLEPEAEQLKSQLELAEASSEAGGVEEARKAAEAEPENLGLKLKLADALAVAGKYQEAFELCLEVVRTDRDGTGEAARETMVKIFTSLGNTHPLVGEYRRKLATALY